MTPEWVAAIASVATFVVISATAIVTLIQLRHMRNSNQIAVFTDIRHRMETPDFQDALRFIRYELPQKLNDSAFRVRLLDRNSSEGKVVVDVGNFLDSAVAPLVKHGIVDRNLACDLFYYPVVMCWDTLASFIASRRTMLGYRLWEDFEYLTLLCRIFARVFRTVPIHQERQHCPCLSHGRRPRVSQRPASQERISELRAKPRRPGAGGGRTSF